MDNTTKQKLIKAAQLIFYGLPIGKNAPGDTPLVGPKSIAQVVVNRVNSVCKNREEFKYMVDCIMEFIKETEGKSVSKIKMNVPTKELYGSGLIDSKGFIIKKSK